MEYYFTLGGDVTFGTSEQNILLSTMASILGVDLGRFALTLEGVSRLLGLATDCSVS